MVRRAWLDDKRPHVVERQNSLHSFRAADTSATLPRLGQPTPSPRFKASATRVVLAVVVVWLASNALASASTSISASGGPWINRALLGGVNRDMSILELRAMNRAKGIAFPR